MRALTAIWLTLLCLAGTGRDALAFDHAGVARNAVEQHIRPGYKRLAEATAALEETLKTFCADQREASLDAAKQAYAGAVTAWGRIEHLRFGPIMEEHRHERIVFWPDPKGIGALQVSRAMSKNDPTLISPETLARKSVALQGLTALEQVLYGGGGLLGQKSGFRCQYAMAIGANLAGVAAKVDAAWNAPDGYARLMLTPGPDNAAYQQPSEVTQELVMAYTTGLLSVRNLKIGAPLGLVESSKVSSAAFGPSGLDRAVIAANLEGIRELFKNSGLGVEISVEAKGAGQALLNEFDIALKIITGLTVSLDEVARTPKLKQEVAVIGFALKNAYETGAARMKAAANLSLGFNALDGD
jgi:predicted lipoprotein